MTAVKLLRNSVRRLPERRLNELSEHAREIARIALAKSQTRDIQQYRELLRREADHTGALPALIVSDYVAGQHRYPRFAAWCQQAYGSAHLPTTPSTSKMIMRLDALL